VERDRTALRADAQQLEQAGRLDDAIAVLEQLFSEPSPDAEWLRDAIALSRCYRDAGSCEQAVAVGERAAPHVERLGLVGLTEAIQLTVTVAGAELFLGDPGRAMRTCRRALAAAEKHGSAVGKASALWNMCLVETARGNIVTAIVRAREALVTFETSDDVRNIARLRTEIAALQLDLDPPDPAEALRLLADHELDLIGAGGSA
jgi:tetratricopeptide (TPR) repeat protein